METQGLEKPTAKKNGIRCPPTTDPGIAAACGDRAANVFWLEYALAIQIVAHTDPQFMGIDIFELQRIARGRIDITGLDISHIEIAVTSINFQRCSH